MGGHLSQQGRAAHNGHNMLWHVFAREEMNFAPYAFLRYYLWPSIVCAIKTSPSALLVFQRKRRERGTQKPQASFDQIKTKSLGHKNVATSKSAVMSLLEITVLKHGRDCLKASTILHFHGKPLLYRSTPLQKCDWKRRTTSYVEPRNHFGDKLRNNSSKYNIYLVLKWPFLTWLETSRRTKSFRLKIFG